MKFSARVVDEGEALPSPTRPLIQRGEESEHARRSPSQGPRITLEEDSFHRMRTTKRFTYERKLLLGIIAMGLVFVVIATSSSSGSPKPRLHNTEPLQQTSSNSTVEMSPQEDNSTNLQQNSTKSTVEVKPQEDKPGPLNQTETSKQVSKTKHVLIVGAGLSGSIIGERIASTCENAKVKIIEKRNHIGGNVYDYIDDETGIRVHKYGIHIFHTVDPGVWK
jgi:hypothetical protein